jgi:hypothetical protein
MNKYNEIYSNIDDFKHELSTLLLTAKKQKEVRDLDAYYEALMLFKCSNRAKPIELLNEHLIDPYHDILYNKNMDFFITQLDDDRVSTNINSSDILFIDQIKCIWNDLSFECKENIWTYILSICIQCEQLLNTSKLISKFDKNSV